MRAQLFANLESRETTFLLDCGRSCLHLVLKVFRYGPGSKRGLYQYYFCHLLQLSRNKRRSTVAKGTPDTTAFTSKLSLTSGPCRNGCGKQATNRTAVVRRLVPVCDQVSTTNKPSNKRRCCHTCCPFLLRQRFVTADVVPNIFFHN